MRVKLVPNDEVLVGEPVEVIVEAAVVDWIGVALIEVVLECETIRVVVDGEFQMDPWAVEVTWGTGWKVSNCSLQTDPWAVEASKWPPRTPPKSAAQTHLERVTKE